MARIWATQRPVGVSREVLRYGLLGMAFGCTTEPSPSARLADAHALPGVLADVAGDPTSTPASCARLQTPSAHAECVLHGVERLARADADAAAAMCGALSGVDADECFFQVAERSGEPQRCQDAGRFAEDCRMHAWTVAVPKLGSPATAAGTWAERISAAAAEMGFPPDDPRPWIAASRVLLGRSVPLDRSFCDGWDEPARTTCRNAGLGLLHDRINHARDTGKWTCTVGPPALMSVADDAELEAVIKERRSEVCP